MHDCRLTVVEKVEAAIDPDALLQNLRGWLAGWVFRVGINHDGLMMPSSMGTRWVADSPGFQGP